MKKTRNTLFYQLPLFFGEGDFCSINEELDKAQGWKLKSRPEIEDIFEGMGLFNINVENVFQNNSVLRMYSFDEDATRGQLFNDTFLEFEFEPGKETNQDSGEHDITNSKVIHFKVEHINLHLFSNGIGFLSFQVEVGAETDELDLLQFNASFDILYSSLEGRNDRFYSRLPRKIYKLDRKFLKNPEKGLNGINLRRMDLLDGQENANISMKEFCSRTRDKVKYNPETKQQTIIEQRKYFYLSDVISLLLGNVEKSLSEIGKAYLERSNLFRLSVYNSERYEDEFFKQFASFRTNEENLSEIQDQNVYSPVEQVKYTFLNQGGTVYLSGENSVNDAIYNNRTLYFYIAMIRQLQKKSFQKIFYDISKLSSNISGKKSIKIKDLIKELDKINLYFLSSYTQFWFSDISSDSQVNTYYSYWQSVLALDKDYDEIKSELALLNEYLERANKKRTSSFTNVITFILFPITIMAGLLGVNISELGSGTRSLFSTQGLFVIAVSILFPTLIWLFVRKK